MANAAGLAPPRCRAAARGVDGGTAHRVGLEHAYRPPGASRSHLRSPDRLVAADRPGAHRGAGGSRGRVVRQGDDRLGGSDYRTDLDDGAAYEPSTNTWRKIAASPLSPRQEATAVWTGEEMIVWGGNSFSTTKGNGAAYDPNTDTWRACLRHPSRDGTGIPRYGPEPRWSYGAVTPIARRSPWGMVPPSTYEASSGRSFLPLRSNPGASTPRSGPESTWSYMAGMMPAARVATSPLVTARPTTRVPGPGPG